MRSLSTFTPKPAEPVVVVVLGLQRISRDLALRLRGSKRQTWKLGRALKRFQEANLEVGPRDQAPPSKAESNFVAAEAGRSGFPYSVCWSGCRFAVERGAQGGSLSHVAGRRASQSRACVRGRRPG